MGLSIKGFVLEPPRVGSSNSPFTFTPNDFIQNLGVFDAYYTPGVESVSRTDYCILVQTEGLLVNANFGFTKNEGTTAASVRRFDYDSKAGHFRPLPGSTPDAVGVLASNANTNPNRLKVRPPIGALAAAPFRLYLRTGLASDTFPITLVPTEGSFGAPAVGTVEISLDKGTINWNAADITANLGAPVSFQRQSFFGFSDSSGRLGLAQDTHLLLNPLPGPGQFPRIRFGFGFDLTPIEKPTEGGFSINPLAGTVEWSADTGRLKFNSGDVLTNTDRPVYYDGVLFSWKQPLMAVPGGTVFAPLPLLPVPATGGDIIFRTSTGYQFPVVRRVTAFDAGTAGEVQLRTDGAVQYSAADVATYGALGVTVYVADVPVERGVSFRFFRSTVNLDGADPTVKDVAAIYQVKKAIWASPIIQSPYVFLPATPIQDLGYPLAVYVEQGTGSFTGPLPDLGVAPGLGYFIDYEAGQLNFGQRKVNQIFTATQPTAFFAITDVPVRPEHLLLELETSPGTGIYTPLVQDSTALFDGNTGLVTVMSLFGKTLVSGSAPTFAGTLLTDPTVDFITAGVLAGNVLVIPLGAAAGVYTITARTTTTLTVDLPAPVPVAQVPYEVHQQGEVAADRYFQEVVPLDPNTKVERVRGLGSIQNELIVYTGLAPGVFSTATTMVDSLVDFGALGVLAGDTIKLTSGPDLNSYRTITIVDGPTLTVDRPFTSFLSATYQVCRRLHVPRSSIPATRVRIGTTFTTPVQVATNLAFGAPVAGTCEVSLETGDLNFAFADLGVLAFWGLTLRFPTDFKVSKDLGFVELETRLLTNDEMYITYRPVTSDGVQPPVTEHVGFLIRKEVTQPWPRPMTTNSVVFNPAGRTVAPNPPPAVYRGGRPQDDTQIDITLAPSTITFLPNTGFMTNALPSGSNLEPDERVLLDYFVYEAVGGEKSFNVLQPPIYAALVVVQTGAKVLLLNGNQTALFPVGHLLRVEQQEAYLIGTTVYVPADDQTVVTLAYGASFQNDYINPKLYVSSGPIPLTTIFPQPSYFQLEMSSFGAVPRGMNVFNLPGDLSLVYQKGTVVLFTDNATYYDLYLVSGASAKDGATQITLQQNVRQQYLTGTSVLKRSVRPILEDGVTQVTTHQAPILEQGVTVYRRVSGQIGTVLQAPEDYTIDAGGTLRYTPALQFNESISILYTSLKVVPAGTRLRASYTSGVTPNDQNGLLGQILKADYYLYQGDSFYYRVETLTNFSAEVEADLEAAAQAGSPSGGPTTSNASTPTLFEQGRESLFFTEGHTWNVDYVSRAYLKFFNDNTHRLEDVLQDEDGRVIGDLNGRFRFDGLTTNPVRTAYTAVTNEIDDRFKVSDFPIALTSIFPLVFTYLGTYQALYQPSGFSRLFPTEKGQLSAVTTAGSNTAADSGDKIADFGIRNFSTLPGTIYRRLPRAYIIQDAPAGSTDLFVDFANGETTFLRPPFAAAMKVVIRAQNGTDLVSDATPLTVTAVLSAPERIQVGALPVNIPAGSTVFLCVTGPTPDTSYWKLYRQGFDILVDSAGGLLIYVKPYPPFDGSIPLVPAPLEIQDPAAGEVLEMDGTGIFQFATAPFKVPALFGEVASDCGDQSIPILSPTQAQEIEANQREAAAITAAQAALTTEVTLSAVSLDATGTLLTYGFAFPAPVPQLYDLVEFTSGPNAAAGYRRISAIAGPQLTVDAAFPVPSSVGSIVITASTNVATGPATFPVATVLDDPGLSAAIQVGHTVVLTAGPNVGIRRQVVSRLSATQLQLDFAVPFLVATPYRVSNHIRTYSNWGAVISAADTGQQVLLTNDHNITPPVVDSVVLAITRFFEGDLFSQTTGVLTDLLTPASNAGTVAGAVLTGLGQDFVTAGVNQSHFVYIETGFNEGFYAIQSVDSPTQITATTPFPVAGAISYRVVKAFGVGATALKDLFDIRLDAELFSNQTPIWTALLAFTVPVFVPPGVTLDLQIYANAISGGDLVARSAFLAARLALITDPNLGPVPKVTAIVKTRDKLYDKRYSWIDARTNVQTGSLYVIQRAVSDRVTATAKLYNDLLKLLSVQSV